MKCFETGFVAIPVDIIICQLKLRFCENISNIFLNYIMFVTIYISNNSLATAFFLDKFIKWEIHKQALNKRQTNHSCWFIKHNSTAIHMRNLCFSCFPLNLKFLIDVVNKSRYSRLPIIHHNRLVYIKFRPNVCCGVH